MEDTLIDRIYEAAFVPDAWPQVLEAASSLSGSASGAIFVFSDGRSVRGRSQDIVQPLFDEFLAGDTWKFSEGVQRMCSLQPASFVRVEDFMTSEEIEHDPVRINARAFGIGNHVCTAVALPSGELVTFVFQRWMKDGGYDGDSIDRLDGLRPHLARAGLMAARLGLEQAAAAVSALRAIGLPAAMLTASGRVLAANSLLENMPGVFLATAGGRIAIADASANALFQQAILAHGTGSPVRSIPVPATEGHPALVVHVLPLRGAASDIFSGADVMVAATVVSASATVPSPTVLAGLFDLTPAEAKLATALTTGRSLRSVAIDNGVTFSTARTYLDRVYRKTGTNRQSQLVALLKSAQPFQA